MKFHQMEGTCPLTSGQLLQDIVILGTGTYLPPPGTKKDIKTFLSVCKQSSEFSHLNLTIFQKSNMYGHGQLPEKLQDPAKCTLGIGKQGFWINKLLKQNGY